MSDANKSMHSFDDWTDEEVQEFLTENNFIAFRKLETGEWIGLFPLAFTLSVCMDITPTNPYAYRWCFHDPKEATLFFATAKEYDEVPTERKSLKGHRWAKPTGPLIVEYDEQGFPRW